MSEIFLTCPTCNKEIHTESNVKTLFCPYCENRLDVKKEIERQGIQTNDHKSVYTQITELMELAEKALEKKAYIETFACYLEVLKMDKNYIEAARALLKAANLAIENHFKVFEHMYESQGYRAVNHVAGADLELYYQAREEALAILDAYGPNYEPRCTEIEKVINAKIKKQRRRFNIARLITIILTLVVFVGGMTALLVLKY